MVDINKIYNEDCLEFMKRLPNKSINLIIADPPYNIGCDGGDGWDTVENYLSIFEDWCKEWKRILTDKGLFYCYSSQQYHADLEIILRKYFVIQNRLIWAYNNGQRTSNKSFSISYEPFFMASKNKENDFIPVRDINNIQKGTRSKRQKNGTITITQPNPDGIKLTDVWSISKLSGNMKETTHPTEKPLILGERMLKSINADLVYIPFAGSGTEIKNCLTNKINYISTELNIDYIKNIIEPRISEFQ